MDILQLERLESRSLVERLGEGMKTRIGMHDLWRAFCEAEAEHGELGRRRWVMKDAGKSSELLETSPSSSCWENVKRMSLVDCESTGVEKVNFGHFVNLRVFFQTVHDKEGCGGCITVVLPKELGGVGEMSSQIGSPRFAQEPYLPKR